MLGIILGKYGDTWGLFPWDSIWGLSSDEYSNDGESNGKEIQQ